MMNVLDFIDSPTLREMMKSKDIPPAIECILIAQSDRKSITDKASAIRERLDKYTDEDFEKGIYHCPFNNLRECAERYISHIEKAEKLINKQESDVLYVIKCLDAIYDGAVFGNYPDAMRLARHGIRGECTIIRRKINSYTPDMEYYLNKMKVIIDVWSRDLDVDESLRFSCAELNDDFKTGDIVCYSDDGFEKYAVVASDRRFETKYCISCSDYTDMSLYCLEFVEYDERGSFPHLHIPILKARLVSVDELPPEHKQLKNLSRTLKGEVKFADFIEAYSMGYLDQVDFR